MSNLVNLLEEALLECSKGDYFLELLNAKKEYFHLTGLIDEEDQEYESRMNCFNDWYLFQYRPKGGPLTVIQHYANQKKLDEELVAAFNSCSYSLYEYVKVNMKNQMVLMDVLHQKKIILSTNHQEVALVPKDLFIGRVITYQNNDYLLRGTCVLPQDAKSICRKQTKKVKKLDDKEAETTFLITLESLKTRWIRYGHVSVSKIFTFPS